MRTENLGELAGLLNSPPFLRQSPRNFFQRLVAGAFCRVASAFLLHRPLMSTDTKHTRSLLRSYVGSYGMHEVVTAILFIIERTGDGSWNYTNRIANFRRKFGTLGSIGEGMHPEKDRNRLSVAAAIHPRLQQQSDVCTHTVQRWCCWSSLCDGGNAP